MTAMGESFTALLKPSAIIGVDSPPSSKAMEIIPVFCSGGVPGSCSPGGCLGLGRPRIVSVSTIAVWAFATLLNSAAWSFFIS